MNEYPKMTAEQYKRWEKVRQQIKRAYNFTPKSEAKTKAQKLVNEITIWLESQWYVVSAYAPMTATSQYTLPKDERVGEIKPEKANEMRLEFALQMNQLQ